MLIGPFIVPFGERKMFNKEKMLDMKVLNSAREQQTIVDIQSVKSNIL
jgi:hypothetical protein